MFRLVRNLILLAALLTLIKAPFAFYDTDPVEERQVRTLMGELSTGNYNAVFVGSSRTGFGIDASAFDRATAGRTRSVNFGVSAGLPPETFEWCREIIERDRSLKYMFVELSGLSSDLPFEMFPARAFRVQTYPFWLGTLPVRRWAGYHDRLIATFLRPPIPSLGRVPDRQTDTSKLLASFERGKALERPTGTAFRSRHEEYLRQITSLIEFAGSRGVAIYFFVPPRLETDNEMAMVYPVYHRLDPRYVINGGHHEPDVNTVESSLDEFHLNPVGAALFTDRLAAAFNDRTR